MNWGVLRLLASCLAVALGFAAAQPASAEGFAAGSVCHASASAAEDYAALAGQPSRWDCTGRDWSIATPRAFLRFDMRGADYAPVILVTRLTRFAAMRITVVGADGHVALRDVREADMTPGTGDWAMSTALPRIAGPVAAVIVRVDGARHVGLLSDARLVAQGGAVASFQHELLIAALCGMLIVPILLNLAFFRVLRERFLLWHSVAVTLMLGYTLVTSGLVNRFAALGIGTLATLSPITIGGAMAAAGLLAADLLEADKLDPLHRRLLRLVAPWLLFWTLFFLFADGRLRPLAAPLGLGAYLPPIALYAWVLGVAKRRGSRAATFQIVAWIPVMLPGLVRIFSMLGAADAPLDVMLAQHVAMGFEAIVTSLGVIDRLMIIRRERDCAVANLRAVEDRAERDPLTGLQNRRAVEKRFETLRAEGFSAMAIIDLDKFKLINDTHGHVTGDAVLRAAAEALEPDADTLAIRMGGEEFLLLLRGRDAANRAERRRQAIAVRVAAGVPGLDRMVTASMGLVELPREGTIHIDFKVLYAHCDRLLYEAKHNGRNRTMREKVQSFGRGAAARQVA